ncbi:alkaline phosphatase family protein [Constantimarinum furrinae]|uniref:Type I phosphodiesterase/nucleotide pyrophosphatase n=1 Tax=Constantimarinum furrinae TaxID=2562285 RepID=A0A7G8PRI8_9FLAO|nr:alkaline phosphatase family protein [Constantimarinum furrinae]QNJ96954.1 Type I phosphodiesterase/nucleotide pyrophosphatase [Constantimarinum furrinae]
MKKNKLLLIGWDAADWKIIGPLLAKGQMPTLKKIIDNGIWGNMSTMNPPYSPMLWSSVATGKTPDKHGVLGFIEIAPDLKGLRPVTSQSRNSRAIWNILNSKGYKSNVVGWWPSYPAEPINGVMVSDKFQKVNKDPKKKNPIPKGVIHPDELRKDMKDLRMFPYEVTSEHILPFIPNAGRIDQEKDKGLDAFAKMFAENVSVHAAATNVMRTTEWDFMAIYYDLIDHFCHAYMKYHPPKMKGVPLPLYEVYKDAVVGAYRFQDMMLERTLDLIDDDTTVVIMSDHGFESGNKRILKMPKYPAAPALDHRQFGIFVASGPNIKKNEKIFGLGLIDVAPTILHHFGLPVGKDMDGNVALDIFKNPGTPEYIDSWENIEGNFGELDKDSKTDQLSDQETMEQLIELGYIERPDEKIETAILKTKCDLKHNLARVYLGKKDYSKSLKLLLELVEEKEPVDVIPYYMDLLTISLKMLDYDKAEEYLNILRERNSEFKLNTYFAEAQILVGKEKVSEALAVLENAKDKSPNSEVWFQIGKLYRRLSRYTDAKLAYEEAILLESDKAKFHRALAEVLLRMGEYEDAAESALTSIELVKYFPEAHYTLGEALEKLGDLENAKIAYETAARLKPKAYPRAEKALENVIEKIQKPLNLEDKNDHKYRKDQIVVVSGLPRSGTSLMMQMLDKAGLDSLVDGKRKADESNPKGYYEYEPVMALHKDNSWLDKAQNKSVKVVAPLLKYLDPNFRYKIVFMTRNLDEVVKSQQKMIGKDTNTIPVKLYNAYWEQLSAVEVWKDKEPGVELIYVDYKDVLENPESISEKVSSFIGVDMDETAMAACVDKSLYRNKVKTAVE